MHDEEFRRKFLDGLEMARDPRNAQARDPQTPRVTTIYSPWLQDTCRKCGHTFREEDIVLPDPANPERMLHDDLNAGLLCASKVRGLPLPAHAPEPHNPETRALFLRGLNQHWSIIGDGPLETVPRRSELVRRKCPICHHTIRPGDQVVRCPCGRNCGGVFHQDLTRHLTCWHTWNRNGQRAHCVFIGAPYVVLPAEAPT